MRSKDTFIFAIFIFALFTCVQSCIGDQVTTQESADSSSTVAAADSVITDITTDTIIADSIK